MNTKLFDPGSGSLLRGVRQLALSAMVGGAALAAALTVGAAPAQAQCRPDDLFCAELRIGPAQPPPPPPPVVVQPPPPPPVIVQPPPPPVVVEPPRPPVVIVQPAPPPPPPPPPRVVVVQPPPPPPRVVVVQPPPPPPPRTVQVQVQREVVEERDIVPAFDLGLHLSMTGMWMENINMGGGQVAFRLRPIEHIALDIGVGLMGGENWSYGVGQGGDRWELPVQADVFFFFNPQHRFQVYALVGVGVSYAEQQLALGHGVLLDSGLYGRAFSYAGGEVGLGFEWRISRRFALNLDARGFIRGNLREDGSEPEFTREVSPGRTQSTDLSGGVYSTVGMTFYFGD